MAEQQGFIPDWVHTGLDFAGFAPGLGAIPDLGNAALYGLEAIPDALKGDWGNALSNVANAGASALAAIPGAGDAWSFANMGRKAAGGLGRLGVGMRRWGEIDEPLRDAGVNPIFASVLASGTTGGLAGLGSKPLTALNFLKNSWSHGLGDFKQNAIASAVRQKSPLVDSLLGMVMGEDPWQYQDGGMPSTPDMPSIYSEPNYGPVQRRLEQGSYWNA